MGSLVVFGFLNVIFLWLAIKFYDTKSIKAFLLFMVVLPFTSALNLLHTRFQISAYFIFIFTLVLLYFLNQTLKQKSNVVVAFVGGSTVLFIGVYLCYDVLLSRPNLDVINILKDIKPLAFIFIGFVLLDIFKDYQQSWDGLLAKKVLAYNFYASLFWFVVLSNTNLIGLVTNDPYYQVNETRYSAIGTSYVIYFFIAHLSMDIKFNKKELLYIFVPLFLSGNRTMLFAIAIVYLVNLFSYAKDATRLLKKGLLFILGFVVLVLGVFSINDKLKERVMSMFNYDLVMEQLFSYRFAPFVSELESFKWYHYIFGKGIGETMFIPWFVYRENIDNFNVTMDNLYMTMYVKYGILSLLVYFLIFWFIIRINTNKRFKILVCLFFLIIGMTTAFIYQTKFLFTLVLLAGFSAPVQQKTTLK
nr:DUF6369 family protein [uncultured Allomuricauda sp.]